MDEVNRACYEQIVRHSKSFALAARLLPARQRHDAVAVYAWCRRADDAVDQSPPEQRQPALDGLRQELIDAYGAVSTNDPILLGFRRATQNRAIPIAYPKALLDGMTMDLGAVRYQTIDELMLYCFRVAGVVGLMMCHVLGVADERAPRHGARLGMAMQLTNIARDIAEDWRGGRLYLPAELFGSNDYDRLVNGSAGPLDAALRGAVANAVERLLIIADRLYQDGDQGLAYLDARCAWSIDTARRVYSAIGARLRQQGCDVASGRAIVRRGVKIGLATKAALAILADLPTRLRGRHTVAPPSLHFRFEDVWRAGEASVMS